MVSIWNVIGVVLVLVLDETGRMWHMSNPWVVSLRHILGIILMIVLDLNEVILVDHLLEVFDLLVVVFLIVIVVRMVHNHHWVQTVWNIIGISLM
jgi:hypothetical protein